MSHSGRRKVSIDSRQVTVGAGYAVRHTYIEKSGICSTPDFYYFSLYTFLYGSTPHCRLPETYPGVLVQS